MKALFNLVNAYYWKSFFGPFFAFGFPLIFVGLLGGIIGFESVLAGSLIIPIVAVSTVSMPLAIFELKRSTLLKRVASSSITPLKFIMLIVGYYAVAMIAAVIFTFLFALLIFGIPFWKQGRLVAEAIPIAGSEIPAVYAQSFSSILETINWGGVIYAILSAVLVGSALGVMLFAIAKTSMMIIVVGTTVLIMTQFLGPMVLPPYMVYSTVMKYITFLTPFKYSISLMLESWNGNATFSRETIELVPGFSSFIVVVDFVHSNPFDLNQVVHTVDFDSIRLNVEEDLIDVVLFQPWLKGLNVSMSYPVAAIFGFISWRNFTWSVRG